MDTKQKIRVTLLIIIPLAASYWIGYAYGGSHAPLQSPVLLFIIILPLLIFPFAKFFKPVTRNSAPPSSASSAGPQPPRGPNPPIQAPSVPRPPGGPPEIYCGRVA